MIEGWDFEIVTLVVATFGPIQLAAQNIVMNLAMIYWMIIAFGISTSLSIVIGNAMGMKMVSLAKTVMKELLLILIVASCLFTVAFLYLRAYLLGMFTDDEQVLEAA